jgi:hypothetical protein
MDDKQLKLAVDTIRTLAEMLLTPISEQNHIDRIELAEAAEIVARGLEG